MNRMLKSEHPLCQTTVYSIVNDQARKIMNSRVLFLDSNHYDDVDDDGGRW